MSNVDSRANTRLYLDEHKIEDNVTALFIEFDLSHIIRGCSSIVLVASVF